MSQTTTGLRFTSVLNTEQAGERAEAALVEQIERRLDGQADLAVIFATGHYLDRIDAIRERITRVLSPEVLLGLTAGGIIGSQQEVEGAPGLSILAASLPGVSLQPFNYEQIDWPTVLESPESLRQSLLSDESGGDGDLRAVVMLADPFSTPMASLLPAIGQALPGVPVIGGMASAARHPGENRLIFNSQTLTRGAVGVAIRGNIQVHCTLSQGCRPIGKPLVITGSKRHVVYELGGHGAYQTVAELIQSLDQEERERVRARGLMIGRVVDEYKERFGRGDFLIRQIVSADEEAGYIVINDPQVRVGQTVQFHVHDDRTAAEDFKMLLEAQQLHGPARGAMLFSCNGRGRHLFGRPHVDTGLVHEALGDVPLAGFFAAGEIGPIGDQNFLHGHTACLAVFRESTVGDDPSAP